ncbi:hypothetical protein [Bradyrhizobium sp. SZCCHNR1015]|uniref:hypothetical protein n=1 Tax=Bradyrhizobium sp. SZCCHNR1015 TaxID=3057338 RepID=UPI0029166360|nr:hypothetical protein [Bradyrhizobium sp. SZCCHNR1015]
MDDKKSNPHQGGEPSDRASFHGVAGEGRVGGGDVANFRGVVGVGEAGQLTPVTSNATLQTAVNAQANIALDPITSDATVTVIPEVIRAPFSPIGIAEKLAENPEFYRRLAETIASELAREAAIHTGSGNTQHVIRGELQKLEQGFGQMAQLIAAKTYDKAAEVVLSLRDGLIAFDHSHPELVDIFGKIAAVSLGTYLLGCLGVPAVLGVLVSASVVKSEKLSDLLKFWK